MWLFDLHRLDSEDDISPQDLSDIWCRVGNEATAVATLGALIGRCRMLSCRSFSRHDRQSRGDSGYSRIIASMSAEALQVEARIGEQAL